MKAQQELVTLFFRNGERVEVCESAPGNVTGFGRIECECSGRSGWYYVRFPDGYVHLVQWNFLLRAHDGR